MWPPAGTVQAVQAFETGAQGSAFVPEAAAEPQGHTHALNQAPPGLAALPPPPADGLAALPAARLLPPLPAPALAAPAAAAAHPDLISPRPRPATPARTVSPSSLAMVLVALLAVCLLSPSAFPPQVGLRSSQSSHRYLSLIAS